VQPAHERPLRVPAGSAGFDQRIGMGCGAGLVAWLLYSTRYTTICQMSSRWCSNMMLAALMGAGYPLLRVRIWRPCAWLLQADNGDYR
jgi:hypothetical protein